MTLFPTSMGGVSRSIAMADVTALSDTVLVKLPARIDPGQVTVECYLTDTVTATNELTVVRTRLSAKTATVLNINLPGANIDDLIDYTGYVMSIGDPTVALGDDVLKFSFTMQITA
jgi:hypothetical protein